MSIPKQAIDAAAKAIADSIGHGMSEKCFDHARAALTAAAPHMSGVKVKPLEWVKIHSCNGILTAKTHFGTYFIGSNKTVRLGLKIISQPFQLLEEAKAAAQADYEKRFWTIADVTDVEPSVVCNQPLSSEMIREYVEDYEWRADGGDYIPNNTKRAMIEDAIAGFAGYVDEVLMDVFRERQEQALEKQVL